MSSTKAYITPKVLTWAIRRSGMTRQRVADAVGVRVELVRDWERGSQPTFHRAQRLADALDIPFGFLWLSAPPKKWSSKRKPSDEVIGG